MLGGPAYLPAAGFSRVAAFADLSVRSPLPTRSELGLACSSPSLIRSSGPAQP